ncbi:hypothetical protein BD324DRAFT_297593 [Kockovaella imperatae]|uniref:Uncharacterized protein n=1 Tax=Kockovaella imperatae TaxID=4999 RepID=A0A1Y1UN75_9TREE|nr:hypothetical protein BD324DRAFT_297593 [Kockovaella imperatae]ORX38906.1 hypothetical protein BD324DRAFT_297593 [Kockovaella imperatae]
MTETVENAPQPEKQQAGVDTKEEGAVVATAPGEGESAGATRDPLAAVEVAKTERVIEDGTASNDGASEDEVEGLVEDGDKLSEEVESALETVDHAPQADNAQPTTEMQTDRPADSTEDDKRDETDPSSEIPTTVAQQHPQSP